MSVCLSVIPLWAICRRPRRDPPYLLTPTHSQPRALRHVTISRTSQETPLKSACHEGSTPPQAGVLTTPHPARHRPPRARRCAIALTYSPPLTTESPTTHNCPTPAQQTLTYSPASEASMGRSDSRSRSPPPRRDRERSSSRDRERSRDRGRAPVRLRRSVPFLKRCANHLSPLAASSRWGWRLRAQRGGQAIRRRAELRDRRGRCPQVRRLRAVSAHHPRLV